MTAHQVEISDVAGRPDRRRNEAERQRPDQRTLAGCGSRTKRTRHGGPVAGGLHRPPVWVGWKRLRGADRLAFDRNRTLRERNGKMERNRKWRETEAAGQEGCLWPLRTAHGGTCPGTSPV